nr:ATP-binding protein [Paenibacillus senegalensis]
MLWMESFREHKQDVKHGQLDLREWNAQEGGVLLLDGEWEFYPSQWLFDDDASAGREQTQGDTGAALESGPEIYEPGPPDAPRLIQVPGGWNEALDANNPTPYGFGSYRMRIYVNPEEKINYSVRIASVRTSSQLYVNGRLLTASGQAASTKEDYLAKNLPYSTTFTADENGVIELVIQAANYVDSRGSGIVRSLKFGSEEAIAKEMKFSVSMQLLGVVIFLVHSIYAFILFLLGNRERKLLYFSLLTFSVAFTSLLSNDEKLFHQLFYIGSDWDFRLANAVFIIGLYALLECTEHRELRYWRRVYPWYTAVNLGTAGITLTLAPAQVIALFPVYFLLACIALTITIAAIIKTILKDVRSHLLLLFSILALVHHFLWTVVWRESGLSLTHYPFDLIIATGCFASVWFKNYFKMHASTKELAAALQRMNDHKDQFLANTSHEFKNPLHGILNLSEAVLNRERSQLQERSVRELETVLAVGRRMSLILNDLIDVMSLREGTPRLQKEAIRIQPIITAVIDMLQFNAEVKGITIVSRIPEDFPPVLADENRLVQIMFNLLHNAVKFSNEGSISVQASEKDGRAFISVADTGIGMDEEMMKRLFLPYEQANSKETMIEGGFGLGLSISKQLVELQGGTLEAASVLGEGSTLTFSLELAVSDAGREHDSEAGHGHDSEAGHEHEAAGSSASFHEQSALKGGGLVRALQEAETTIPEGPAALLGNIPRRPLILMVDDDPVNLQVMEAILSPDNYEVTMVTSGKEALAMLDKKEWDLVISDIMMPQMSGYELTRKIRERFTLTELPVLLLTARDQGKDIQAGFLAGANDYVAKPVEALEIRSRVDMLTAIKQSAREQLRLETAWLQTQIQPHFLFNSLNAISALSEIDIEKMQTLLDEFCSYLRSKFRFQIMDELVPLEDELNLVRSYLYIEKVRFEDMLQVVWEIDDVEGLKLPFLTIQPLVENAVRHGIMQRQQGGTLTIRISAYETHVRISIEDDGAGMDEATRQHLLERKADSESGVGLLNTNQRLKRHFGKGLLISSEMGRGTRVSFTVPR